MKPLKLIDGYIQKVADIVPNWLPLLALRLSIFFVFWKSVQTKIEGGAILGQKLFFWNVTDSTIMLFEYEYDLPLLPYNVAAYLGTFAEFFFALGLLFGLLTRISAFGLLMVTAVIQFFVYPDVWQEHLIWAAILLAIFKYGPGAVSIDSLLKR